MKNRAILSVFLTGSFFLSACSKKEETTAPSTSQTPAPAAATTPPMPTSVDRAVTAAQNTAVEVQATAVPPVTQVKAPETPAAQPSVQGILDQVKGLLNDKKYPEALAALSQLSNVSLSAEQQKLVEQLKTQVQNAMASQTANDGLKAVGGLLNKK